MTTPSPGPKAGSRRFWTTVLCFAVANTAAWFGYHKWAESREQRRDILAVQSFGPGEGATLNADHPTLRWTFNLDVGKPGPVPNGPDAPGSIEPAVPGTWNWLDARTLSFEPTEKLARATRYTVKLKSVTSTTGFTLPEEVVHHVSTTPLYLESVKQIAFDDQQRVTLELTFSDKVIPGELLNHLEISSAGKSIKATLLGQAAGDIIRVQTEPFTLDPTIPSTHKNIETGRLRLTLLPGLAGMSGPLGLADPVTRDIQVAQVILADSLTGNYNGDSPIFYLAFNNDLSPDSLDALTPLIQIEPKVEFSAQMRNWEHHTLELHGPFIAGTRYTLRIVKPVAENGEAAAGGGDDLRKLPRPATLSAVMPDREPFIEFTNSNGFLGSKGNRTLLVKTVNVPAVRVQVSRVYENNLVTWRNTPGWVNDYDSADVTNAFAHPIASHQYLVGGKKNQTQDLRINLDELLGSQAADGTYAIEMAVDSTGTDPSSLSNEQFWSHHYRYTTRYSLVTLSDIGLTAKLMADADHPANQQGLLVWALGLSSGQSLADVKIRVYSNKNQLLGEGATDASGLARIDHLNPAPGESPTVIIASRADDKTTSPALTWLDLKDMARSDSSFATNGTSYLRSGYEAYLWPERGVYRPGETVTLRAIVRGPNLSTPTEKLPVRWQMRRPDGRDWLAQNAQLDADGASEIHLTIPADAPTGYYSARLGLPGDAAAGSAGMATFGGGGASFQVEEFIPNRIKATLTITDDKKRHTFNQPLTAAVQADYLFGQPAAGLQNKLSAYMTPATFTTDAFPASDGWQSGDTASAAEPLGGTRPTPFRLDTFTTELSDAGHGTFKIDLKHRQIGLATSDVAAGAEGAGPDLQPVAAPIPGPSYVIHSGDTLLSIARQFSPDHPEDMLAGIRKLNEFPDAEMLTVGRLLIIPQAPSIANIPVIAKPAGPALDPAPAEPAAPIAPTTPTMPTVPIIVLPLHPAAPVNELYTFHGPWHVSLTSETIENGGRALTAYAATEADALPYYIMARRSDKSANLTTGQPVNFDLRLVTPAGKTTTTQAPIEAVILRESWNSTLTRGDGHYQYVSTRVLEPVKNSATRLAFTPTGATFNWKPQTAGSYIAQFSDGTQVTTLAFYVSDANGWSDTISLEHPERIDVQLVAADSPAPADGASLPAKDADLHPVFREGQPVKAIIKSPFAGKLLLTVETDHILFTKVIDMTASAVEVPLDMPAGIWPNGYVSATVVRAIDSSKEWTVHRAYGIARFTADPADQKLTIALAAPTEMRPNKTLDVDLAVTDSRGNPVANAAIALAAVDEGILRLTDYQTPKPLSAFSSPRALGVQTSDVYASLMPEVLNTSAVGGDEDPEGFSARHSSPVTAKRVKPVSLVSDIVHTDSAGHITAHLQVPEFLGQLRIMAVGYGGPKFGAGQATTLVRSPLVVESSFPRFLAPGDRSTVPLVVINNSAAAGTATIKLTTDSGDLLAFGTPQKEITLNAGQQRTLSFDMLALQAAGIAHITLEATMGSEHFTEHLELPIRPASPEITAGNALTAIVGTPLEIKSLPVMLKGTEHFELRITQRPVLNLPDGLAYLDHYPYGCLEQTTSACFPLVYLPDIGKQIAPGVFEQDRVQRKVDAGILRIVGMQTASGGISMWPGQSDDWTWGTIYAAHFLVEAEHAGYHVPEDFKARLHSYLRTLLTKTTQPGEMVQNQAYAAYVLALDGTPDRPMMNRLGEFLAAESARPDHGFADVGQAQFHLALAWAAAGRKDLAEKLLPQQLPAVRTTRQLAGNIGSPQRDQALMIMTLLTISPDHPALPSLVQNLSAAGSDLGWRSTQDNAFAVMALGKYLRTTKDDKSFDHADLMDGEKSLGQAKGSDALVWSADVAKSGLTVNVGGPAGAKAFVSWIDTGVPIDMPADADHALKIRRRYLHEDGTPLAANETLTTGQSLRVEITVDTPTSLSNVVLEDLLPAGLEAENQRLAGTLSSPPISSARTKSQSFNPSRLDFRDDRVTAMGSLPAGTSTWSYLARAVTPGTYIVPPVRGECMYDPAINSLSGGGAKLTINPLEKKVIATP